MNEVNGRPKKVATRKAKPPPCQLCRFDGIDHNDKEHYSCRFFRSGDTMSTYGGVHHLQEMRPVSAARYTLENDPGGNCPGAALWAHHRDNDVVALEMWRSDGERQLLVLDSFDAGNLAEQLRLAAAQAGIRWH
jgi:hypothetical protein